MRRARREAWQSVSLRASRTASRALFIAAALLCALPCAAQPAGGAQGSAAEEERRTRLFKEGKAAADAGQWVEAAEKFRKVVDIRSAPKALIALGVAEEHLGRLVAALAAYKQAREEAADKALADELKTANAALDAIKPRVPRLVFSPADAAESAQIEVDGVPRQARLRRAPGRSRGARDRGDVRWKRHLPDDGHREGGRGVHGDPDVRRRRLPDGDGDVHRGRPVRRRPSPARGRARDRDRGRRGGPGSAALSTGLDPGSMRTPTSSVRGRAAQRQSCPAGTARARR